MLTGMKLFSAMVRLVLKTVILLAGFVLVLWLLLYAARVTMPMFLGVGFLLLERGAWDSLTPGSRKRRCSSCSGAGPWKERRVCEQRPSGPR